MEVESTVRHIERRGTVISPRRILYSLGLILSLLCLYFFGRRLANLSVEWDALRVGALVHVGYALALLLLSYGFAACLWRSLLKLLGRKIGLRQAVSIFLVTQFGKYLPGNVGQHIGRVALARSQGLPVVSVLVSMLGETALVLSLMMALSLPVLAVYIRADALWLVGGIVLLAMAALVVWLDVGGLNTRVSMWTGEIRLSGSRRDLFMPVLLAAATIFASGFSMLVLDERFLAETGVGLYAFSVFCAAWVAGFVTPGSPAGIGIRELILSEGLSPIVGREGAAVAALLLRGATTLADILAFGIGLLMIEWKKRGHEERSETRLDRFY